MKKLEKIIILHCTVHYTENKNTLQCTQSATAENGHWAWMNIHSITTSPTSNAQCKLLHFLQCAVQWNKPPPPK
jgi:hypothetical protein